MYLGVSLVSVVLLLALTTVVQGAEQMKTLGIEPYPHGLKVTTPELPGEFIRWMVPEAYTYGEQHRGFSSSSYKQLDGQWCSESAFEVGSIFRITLTPQTKCVSLEILLDNTQGTRPLPPTSWGICADFVNADTFYAKDALTRAFIIVDGNLTPLTATDRSRSLGLEMPVYAVKGMEGFPGWRDKVENGYGWGLSATEADNSFICIASKDGKWVLGTYMDPVSSLSFNTKGTRIHGCIHSNPALPEVPVGASLRVTGRLYLLRGTPDDLWKEVQIIRAFMPPASP
jgi:hypothetical protein